MLTVALLNALGREGRGDRPTEVVLMLAYGTAERGRKRVKMDKEIARHRLGEKRKPDTTYVTSRLDLNGLEI